MGVFVTHQDVAPAEAAEVPVGAGGDSRSDFEPATTVALAKRDLGPLIILPQHVVDHTRHRVGAVNRRGTVRDDFDPLDRRQRNGVRFSEGLRGAGVGNAVAIDQHQRRRLAETAQIDRVALLVVVATLGTAFAELTQVANLWKRPHDIGGVSLARGNNGLAIHRDRLAADWLYPGDVGAGDDDFTVFGSRAGFRGPGGFCGVGLLGIGLRCRILDRFLRAKRGCAAQDDAKRRRADASQ